jgi:hypothetical protein
MAFLYVPITNKYRFKMKILHFLILFFTFLLITAQAQDFKNNNDPIHVKGKSQVRVENNMTPDQAREKAEELAIINAIQEAFGTYVEQEADITLQNGTISYNIIGGTKVKGEWLKTDNEPVFKDEIEEQQNGKKDKEKITWKTCNIEGLARRITPKAKLNASTLRCTMLDCETTSFMDGQNFYLYFKSPVDGYLSVFIDEDGETARRLFPYLNQGNESAVKITGDKPYFLFANTNKLNQFDVRADEIELFTYKALEYNSIYVIFSPIPYCKPILSDASLLPSGYTLPKAISTKKFQEWLGDCRVAMPDFQSQRIKISIAKN